MIRELVADTLAGLIFLAIVGGAVELLGPTMTTVLGVSSLVGFIVRPAFDRRRQARADRLLRDRMNRNRERMGLVPIGRASRSRLSFPDRAIIPTRDATFGE